MSSIPIPPNANEADLPRNLPTLNITNEEMEPGWRKVPVGALVKTWYQAFSLFPRPEWKLCAYMSSERFINQGFANYRAPASLGAWVIVLCALPRKLYRRWKKEI